jgi:hypothetical protein
MPWMLLLYAAASLVHFAHNAEYLTDYPNLPAWLSRAQIYFVWLCITALGAMGYLIYRKAHELTGLIIVGVYAVLGFDGLLHYGRAPMAQHTSAMNVSIWFEVAAAALLFSAVLILLARYGLRRGRVSRRGA